MWALASVLRHKSPGSGPGWYTSFMADGTPESAVFLPRCLGPLLGRLGRPQTPSRAVEGTVLFCDVSGFTPMTEALSVLGREGAEELTRVLNTYFTRMIGLTEASGGDVLRFGGDAMTVLFEEPCGDHPLRCALAMMGAMGEFGAIPTRAGTFSLSMKIGAARGTVLLGIVGDEASGRDYYAAGAPLDAAAEAEHHASPGLVVLHPSLLAAAEAPLETEPLAEGFARLLAVPPRPGGPFRRAAPLPLEGLNQLVPDWLAERAGAGTLGEHRGTAVLFLSLGGFDWSDAGVHGRVDAAFRVLASAAKRYGGVLNKVDMGDKGAKGILLFGAPYALERKEEMAARAALACLASPDLPAGLTLKAGLTSAPLFSGPVGAPSRREFTVMGDGINLAARLMGAAAGGQILVSRPVRDAAPALVFEDLGSIRVKGKAEPIEISRPTGERAGPDAGATEDLLEREAALEALRSHLFGSAQRPIALLGGPGLGKTALARWAYREAKLREVAAAFVPLAPYSADDPFSAWRGVVRGALGLKRGDGIEVVRAARERGLSEEEPGFRPALNPLLGLPDEEAPALKGLSPKERKDLAFALAERLLRRAGERVILLDGLQWADPLSLELLAFLLGSPEVRPWRLAAFGRESLAAVSGEGWDREGLAHLSDPATRTFLVQRRGLYDLSDKVLTWFQERAHGNPGTLLALLEGLENSELLQPGPEGRPRVDEDRLFRTVFPDTLEGLYLQRVDRLPASARRLLQDAAVLGYSVSENLLRHTTALEADEFSATLVSLRREGLLVEATRGERPYHTFAAPLLRDAVYAGIPFAQRRAMHAAALAFLEAEGQGDRPSAWPSLAHHAEEAGETERARTYHRRAGREAFGRYDNQTALRHLEFVCKDLSAEPESIDEALRLLDVYGFLGQREGASVLLTRLEDLDPHLIPAHRARLRYFRAQACWQSQRWQEAETLLQESLAIYRSASDTIGVGKTLVNLVGGVYGPTGRMEEAEACLHRAIALAPQVGDSVFRSMAEMNLGIITWQKGDSKRAAAHLTRALRSASNRGMLTGKTLAANNLAGLCYESEDFARALHYSRLAHDLASALGHRQLALESASNLCSAEIKVGHAHRAGMLAREHLPFALHSGARTLVAQFYGTQAQTAFLDCRFEEGFRCARQSEALFRELGLRRFELFEFAEVLRALRDLGETSRAGRLIRRIGGQKRLAEEGRQYSLPGSFQVLLGGPGGCEENDLDARLLRLEESAVPEGRSARSILRLLPAPSPSLAHEIRVRLTYRRVVLGETPEPWKVLQLLGRSLGGIWGLRLLGLLYRQARGEGARPRARSIRLRALRHLYHCHRESPAWSWDRVRSFPEIEDLLRGRPS